VLKFFNLSDAYERKARFFPAFLTALVSTPLLVAIGVLTEHWWIALPSALVLSAVVVLISHLASAAGNRIQSGLYPRWPHDSPTNLWLLPDDQTCSAQQKQRWYEAIKRLVGLDIVAVATDSNELERVVNDAVRGIRARLWRCEQGTRLEIHNADYGFVRNLTGLRPIWVSLAVLSCLGCWVVYFVSSQSLAPAILATAILGVTIVASMTLTDYVRHTASNYAESFFTCMLALDEVVQRSDA
jgi:hypothetical protein